MSDPEEIGWDAVVIRSPKNVVWLDGSQSLEFNPDFGVEKSKIRLKEVIQLVKSAAVEAMKTPEGREVLRREIAAMQGVPASMVKFEGELQ